MAGEDELAERGEEKKVTGVETRYEGIYKLCVKGYEKGRTLSVYCQGGKFEDEENDSWGEGN